MITSLHTHTSAPNTAAATSVSALDPSGSSKTKSSRTRTDIYQTITDSIITALEAGVKPWSCPWQLAAAMTEVEYDAIMQSNNAEDIAFFISVTFIFKRGLRILMCYLFEPFTEYTSHVIEVKGFKINITHPAYVTVNINADYHINALKHLA